jgi:hypothetical protein
VRTAVGVVIAALILAPLAGWAVRGLRRAAGAPLEGARSTLLLFAEGMIVLGAFILGVIVVIALGASGD